jgi:hypothetical protein
MGLSFSLVADGGSSGDADALANALLHFVQNEVLVGLAAPQYFSIFAPPFAYPSP